MQLRPKFVFLLIPVIVAPILVIGYIAFNEFKEIYVEQKINQIENDLNKLKRRFQYKRQTLSRTLLSINQSAQLYHYLSYKEDSNGGEFHFAHRSLMHYLNGFLKNNSDIAEIKILYKNGIEATSAMSIPVLSFNDDYSNTHWFNAAQQLEPNEVFQWVDLGNGQNNPTLRLITPVKARGMGFKNRELTSAFAVLAYNLQHIINEMTLHKAGNSTSINLYTSKGEKLLHQTTFSPTDLQLQSYIGDNLLEVDGQYIYRLPVIDDLLLIATWHEDDYADQIHTLGYKLTFILFLIVAFVIATIYFGFKKQVLAPIGEITKAIARVADGKTVTFKGVREDELGSLMHAFESMSSDLNIANSKLENIAYHDTLTGLYNRRYFIQLLNKALEKASGHTRKIGVIYLDLDGFKAINDTLGHAAGDEVIRMVAQRLSHCLRSSDTILKSLDSTAISRMGGDEFCLFITDVDNTIDLNNIANRILHIISQPYDAFGHFFHLSCSIGISVFPDSQQNAEELLQLADIAMYASKQNGKNTVSFYDYRLRNRIRTEQRLKSDLCTALTESQFELWYQPQILLRDRSICGCEALIRWRHPHRGLVMPGEFIPFAESSNSIIDISEWVMENALCQIQQWDNAQLAVGKVGVNISNRDLSRASLTQWLLAQTKDNPVVNDHLEIELTESSFFNDNNICKDNLDIMQRHGISLAMDDFGTGYSSLGNLQRLPVDVLKIDKSFVDGIEENKSARAIIRTIVAMGKELRKTIIAEGVETQEQMQFLSKLNVDKVQGFYFYRPMPASEFTLLLERHKKNLRKRQVS